ncbi:MAG: hypothetical protein DRN04_05365 [Thermoprotei archaeon]|nr:MAG: hypothetical protein DRN04_05365 [Thermoprotei archaeon]
MALTEMMDKYGAEEALRKIFRWGYEMGHKYALRLGKDLKRYTNIFKDSPFFGRLGWYLFSGNIPQVEVHVIEIEGYKVLEIFVRDYNCPWCLGFEYSYPICSYPCGTYEAGTLTWFMLIGKIDEYCAITRESKCKARGGPCCKLSVVYSKRAFNRKVR